MTKKQSQQLNKFFTSGKYEMKFYSYPDMENYATSIVTVEKNYNKCGHLESVKILYNIFGIDTFFSDGSYSYINEKDGSKLEGEWIIKGNKMCIKDRGYDSNEPSATQGGQKWYSDLFGEYYYVIDGKCTKTDIFKSTKL